MQIRPDRRRAGRQRSHGRRSSSQSMRPRSFARTLANVGSTAGSFQRKHCRRWSGSSHSAYPSCPGRCGGRSSAARNPDRSHPLKALRAAQMANGRLPPPRSAQRNKIDIPAASLLSYKIQNPRRRVQITLDIEILVPDHIRQQKRLNALERAVILPFRRQMSAAVERIGVRPFAERPPRRRRRPATRYNRQASARADDSPVRSANP